MAEYIKHTMRTRRIGDWLCASPGLIRWSAIAVLVPLTVLSGHAHGLINARDAHGMKSDSPITIEPFVITAPRLPAEDRGVFAAGFGGSVTGASAMGSDGRAVEASDRSDLGNDKSGPDGETRGPKCGNPVVLSNGNKIETETDFESASLGGLRLTRTFNLQAGRLHGGMRGMFGGNWFSNLDKRLSFSGGEVAGTVPPQMFGIRLLRGDGSIVSFRRTGDRLWTLDATVASKERIVQSPDGWRYTFIAADGSKETYSYGGSLLSQETPTGARWTFEYDQPDLLTTFQNPNATLKRVVQSGGRWLAFTWKPFVSGPNFPTAGAPIVSSVTDSDGNVIRYDNVPNNLTLGSVTYPPVPRVVGGSAIGSDVVTYHYGGGGRLDGKSINGVRFSTFEYTADSTRVISTRHADNAELHHFSYELTADGRVARTTVTNPFGRQTSFSFLISKIPQPT